MQKFKSWLKYFFGSIFLNSLAKEGQWRSFGNAVLGFFLMIVLVFCGVSASHNAAFGKFYGNADEFKEFVYAAFVDVDLQIDNDEAAGQTKINTYTNDSDAKYKINGYQLVVDLGDIAHTYDDFTPVYVSENGQKISYVEYLGLTEANKKGYSFSIEYSGRILDVKANEEKYKSYLLSVSDPTSPSYDKQVAEAFSNIKASDQYYNERIYELYVHSFYPDMSSIEAYSLAPTVKGYYSSLLQADKDNKYLFIYNDTCMASFYDGDVKYEFTGYYTSLNGFVNEKVQSSADEFISKSFDGGKGLNSLIYLLNFIQTLAFVLLEWIVLSLIVFAVCRLTKQEYGKHVFAGFTIVGSTFFFTGVITFVLSFAFNFMLEREIAYTCALVTMYLVPVIRIAYLLIAEGIKNAVSKNKNKQQQGE